MNKHRSTRVINLSKRSKLKRTSHSHSQVIPFHDEGYNVNNRSSLFINSQTTLSHSLNPSISLTIPSTTNRKSNTTDVTQSSSTKPNK